MASRRDTTKAWPATKGGDQAVACRSPWTRSITIKCTFSSCTIGTGGGRGVQGGTDHGYHYPSCCHGNHVLVAMTTGVLDNGAPWFVAFTSDKMASNTETIKAWPRVKGRAMWRPRWLESFDFSINWTFESFTRRKRGYYTEWSLGLASLKEDITPQY